MTYALARPDGEEDWRAFHEIRRKELFEGRLRGVPYNGSHPGDEAPGNHPLLLKLDNRPVGTVRLDDFGDGTGCIRLVAIAAADQGRGHGRQLEAMLAEYARGLGIRTLFINSAPEAVGFYEKAGWTRYVWRPEELTGIAAACIQMRKAI